MNKLVMLIALLVSSVASAAYLSPTQLEGALNQGFGAGPQLGTHVAFKKLHVAQCKYDFSKQGGSSAAAIRLRDLDNKACALPKDAIVMQAIIDVLTDPTSGATNATIAVGTGQATNDIKGATAITVYTGLVAGIPVGTAASAIKLTADRIPTITVGTEDLTAGKFNVLFEYLMSK